MSPSDFPLKTTLRTCCRAEDSAFAHVHDLRGACEVGKYNLRSLHHCLQRRSSDHASFEGCDHQRGRRFQELPKTVSGHLLPRHHEIHDQNTIMMAHVNWVLAGAPWTTWSCRRGPPAQSTSWRCTAPRWRRPPCRPTCTTGLTSSSGAQSPAHFLCSSCCSFTVCCSNAKRALIWYHVSIYTADALRPVRIYRNWCLSGNHGLYGVLDCRSEGLQTR